MCKGNHNLCAHTGEGGIGFPSKLWQSPNPARWRYIQLQSWAHDSKKRTACQAAWSPAVLGYGNHVLRSPPCHYLHSVHHFLWLPSVFLFSQQPHQTGVKCHASIPEPITGGQFAPPTLLLRRLLMEELQLAKPHGYSYPSLPTALSLFAEMCLEAAEF